MLLLHKTKFILVNCINKSDVTGTIQVHTVSLGRSACAEENIVITQSKIMQSITLFMAWKMDRDS